MTNDRWSAVRDYLGMAGLVLAGGTFIYVADWPRVRPWAGGVWMSMAILTWYGIRRLVRAKAGWPAILYAAGTGTALALFALCSWLNNERLKDAAVFLIMGSVALNWWHQHRTRLNPNSGTWMT